MHRNESSKKRFIMCFNFLCIHKGVSNHAINKHMDRVKRIWYLSPMRAAKVQASLHIRTVSPEPPLLAHTSSESRGSFRQKARSLAPLNGWACTVKFCHDGMLEDTDSLDGAHMTQFYSVYLINHVHVVPLWEDLYFMFRPVNTGMIHCFAAFIYSYGLGCYLLEVNKKVFSGSRSIWVYTVCHSVCIFWMYMYNPTVKPHCTNCGIKSAFFLGV